MANDVVMLTLSNEIDPWAFVRPFTSLQPLAIVELLVGASLGWVLPRWHYGVFIAAVVAPVALVLHGFLLWYFPLGVVAVLNAVHFFAVLGVYSLVFALKQFTGRRKNVAIARRS